MVKNGKNGQNGQKLTFWRVFLDFFSNGTLQRAEVFFVAFSISNFFFWAI